MLRGELQVRAPAGNWPPELELHRPRRVFSALLICLSYLAMVMKMVGHPGVAPGSS